MYEKIMVPLDGSELAECVLPHLAAFISGNMVSTVVLIRVIDPVSMKFRGSYATGDIHSTRIEENAREIEESRKAKALEYLQKIMRETPSNGVQFKTEVIIGRVADRLIDYAEENGVDLILIATHGRSGISRWVRGSIADRILTGSHVPVFMVRAHGMKKELKSAA